MTWLLDLIARKGKKCTIRFKLHQCYEKPGDTEQYFCDKCGNDRFYVGLGSHFTVAKCVKCLHEECVHDG